MDLDAFAKLLCPRQMLAAHQLLQAFDFIGAHRKRRQIVVPGSGGASRRRNRALKSSAEQRGSPVGLVRRVESGFGRCIWPPGRTDLHAFTGAARPSSPRRRHRRPWQVAKRGLRPLSHTRIDHSCIARSSLPVPPPWRCAQKRPPMKIGPPSGAANSCSRQDK